MADENNKNVEEEMPDLENQDGPKLNRGEKKCRKALMKLGMKQFAGVTRVTLRKRDGMIFFVNEPEVLRAADNGNSFVVFGELRLDDPNQRLQQMEAKKFAEQQMAAAQAMPTPVQEEDKQAVEEGGDVSEEGLNPAEIQMVMDHCSCSRSEAVGALKSTGNMVDAVMKLTK